jgi:hypothetical protein
LRNMSFVGGNAMPHSWGILTYTYHPSCMVGWWSFFCDKQM